MKNLYNEDYFERGVEMNISGYTNYRWIPELTIPLAFRMIEVLNINEKCKILDYGCAKGFLVKAFRSLYRNAYGYDLSEYAKSQVPIDVKPYIFENLDGLMFDWVICKDVMEHIKYDDLDNMLKNIREVGKNFFFIIPLGKNGKYIVPSYELDITHIVRENIDWWFNKFEVNNFKVEIHTHKIKNIKENYSKWENGNGFFILERN